MKKSILVLLLLCSVSSGATEGLWNRFDCMYGRESNGPWQLDMSIFSTVNFRVPESEPIFSPMTWITIPDASGRVYAHCGVMRATPAPDQVQLEMYSWSATRFDHLQDCKPVGEGIQLLNSERKTVVRGETVEFLMPWSGSYKERLILTRIPAKSEMEDLEGAMRNFCQDSR